MKKLLSTLEYLLSASAGVVARVESLPLAHLHCTNRSAVQVSFGDFVRGRMGAPQSTRQALGRACRDLEGLFESLLAEAFS
jgi:hypothetical protein